MSKADRLSNLINECADVIFNIVPVMMYKTDEEGVILKVNPDGAQLTQWFLGYHRIQGYIQYPRILTYKPA